MCQLHPFLDQEALLVVTHTLFIFWVNYCNVLYMGSLLKCIQKLQLCRTWQCGQLFVSLEQNTLHLCSMSCIDPGDEIFLP